ncbi:MAG: amino acid adenylation domain-containing protein [Propionibacteriaceae bacterium]|jgi:amino acid adenylation domain-containing protein|nr:amino acid adenylation domain-containing protein [Propionibacteriaceae bacterium]
MSSLTPVAGRPNETSSHTAHQDLVDRLARRLESPPDEVVLALAGLTAALAGDLDQLDGVLLDDEGMRSVTITFDPTSTLEQSIRAIRSGLKEVPEPPAHADLVVSQSQERPGPRTTHRIDLQPHAEATTSGAGTGGDEPGEDFGADDAGDQTGASQALVLTSTWSDRTTPPAAIDLFHQRLSRLAALALDEPETTLGAVDLVTEAERDLIARRNARPALADGRTVHAVVADTATRAPDAIAIVEGEESLTFAEVDRRVRALAATLRRRGIGRGDRVGLMPQRGWRLIVAMVAVMRSGAAFVPLSPQHPAERLAAITADCGLGLVLIGDPAYAGLLPETVETFDLNTDDAFVGSDEAVEETNDPSDECAVLYTSGTTGVPKGVRIRHDTVVNYGLFNWHEWPITQHDVIPQFAPFTFSTAILEITAALFSGARLVTVTDQLVGDPRAFIGRMMECGATIALVTPEYATYLVPWPTLRILETGASLCRPAVWEKFQGAGVHHVNAYGQTEASVPLVWPGTAGPTPAVVPIGRPAPGIQVHVLRGDRPVGLYMPGELCVTGLAVASGYVDRPEEEAAKFVSNPFGEGRMMRTGDWVQWNEHGDIEFFGRRDHQVKIRGQRVELGEVNHALSAIAGVAAAAAIGHEDSTGDTEIVAFVVPAEGTSLDLHDVRSHLQETMVPAMVPAHLHLLETLPLTPHGKVDIATLRRLADEAARHRDDGPAGFAAPASAAERLVAGVFSEVLEVSPISRDDDFFDLGGHSLRAVRAAGLLTQRSGSAIGIEDLFTHPVVSALAAFIEAGGREETNDGAPDDLVESVGGPGVYPMSPAQERLYAASQLDETGLAYNLPVFLELTGSIDVESVRTAFRRLIDRHEALRTGLRIVDGNPIQCVERDAAFDLGIERVETIDELDRTALAARLVHPFDLAHPPLMRAHLILGGDGRSLLFVDIHHTVADGTTLNLVIGEFARFYGGDFLGASPLQYKDWSAFSAGHDHSEARQWWADQFASLPQPYDLPTDFPRPNQRSHRGQVASTVIPADLGARISEVARRHDATEFMVLHTAMSVLVAAHTGADDLVIGAVAAGRTRPEASSIAGLFAETLALRSHPRSDRSFADLLAEVRATCLGAFAHQDLSLDQVVDLAGVRHDGSRNPLFDVLLSVRTIDDATLDLPGVALTGAWLERASAQFDLSFDLVPRPDGSYLVDLLYTADLFTAETAERWLRRYLTVVASALDDPQASIGSLDILDAEERDLVLTRFNDRPFAPEPDLTLTSLFHHAVDDHSDRIALSCDGRRLTFKELGESAATIAEHLAGLGVGPGDIVAVALGRSTTLLEALWGVVASGAAFLPLDVTHPAARLSTIVEDAGVAAIVTDEALPFSSPAPILDLSAPLTGPTALPYAPRPEDPAYCIFTSGSTGTPKGVVVEHRNVVTVMTNPAHVADFFSHPDPVGLSLVSPSFDMSVMTSMLPTVHGATVVIATYHEIADPTACAEVARREKVTIVVSPPSLLTHVTSDPSVLEAWSGLRVVALGGEPFSAPLMRRLAAVAPQARFFDTYGPTEATINCGWGEITSIDDIAIGPPLPGARLYILDGTRPQGIGMPGEICVAGPLVTRGYLNRPELTAAVFVDNPFGDGRLYRTGDRARWRADGRIDFLDRFDDQVKIRGQRIELGEVTARLQDIDGVSSAIAVVHHGELTGVYVGDDTVTAQTISRALRARLPLAMVPTRLHRIEAFPMTTSGKIDRRTLLERVLPVVEAEEATAQSEESVPAAAPDEALTGVVEGIFATVLGRDLIAGDDDFFDLGGHSLHALRAISRIETATGVKVALGDFFRHSTPVALARLISSGPETDRPATEETVDETSVPPVDETPAPLPRGERAPIAPAQRRLYAIAAANPTSSVYTMPSASLVEGHLDVDRLRECLDRLVARHETLRTAFRIDDGDLVAEVIAPQDLPSALTCSVVDSLTAGERERLIAGSIRPFDLARPPLLRAHLVEGPDSSLLILDAHHIAVDGPSLAILAGELTELYAGVELSEPSGQMRDQAAWLDDADLTRDRDWWRHELADLPDRLVLPGDHPRPPEGFGPAAHVSSTVPEAARARMSELARAHRTTERAVMLTAIGSLLGRYGGCDDLVVGLASAGRSRAETDTMAGMLVNTLAIRLRPDPQLSFGDLVDQTHATLVGAQEHEGYPLERLIDDLAHDGGEHEPPFSVMVVLQAVPDPALDLPGTTITALPVRGRDTSFDLVIEAGQGADGRMRIGVDYRADLFDSASMELLVRHLVVHLMAALAVPTEPIGRIPLTDRHERARIATWNATGADHPQLALPHLLAAAVGEHGERIALADDDAQLTYAAWSRASDQVAWRLSELGAGPGRFVAIAAPRSLEWFTGWHGIVKTGAAWIPLDPDLPPARAKEILEACAPVALVTLGEAPWAGEIAVVDLRETATSVAGGEETAPFPLPEIGLDDIAYCLHTSGTTGRPKGVLVPHRGLANLAASLRHTWAITPDDVATAYHQPIFDGSIHDLLTALPHGATLRIIPPQRATDIAYLDDLFASGDVTVASLPPAIAALVDPGRLRLFNQGGSPAVARAEFTGQFVNSYGPTETTITATSWFHTGGDVELPAPIGRPIANTRVEVVDRQGGSVGIAAPGEIVVFGAGVAQGYLGRPELTAERFLTDATGAIVGYRTGDVGRWRADGVLEFLGRIDRQVKVNGVRIEPGEIEAVVRDLPGVADAVVIPQTDPAGATSLACYVVLDEQTPGTTAGESDETPMSALPGADSSVDLARLRDLAATRLPAAMIPAAWMRLDAIPVTDSGKTDRAALPTWAGEVGNEYVAPADDAERAVAAAYATAVGIERVGADDEFLRIGGDSIKAIRVVAALREQGWEIAVADVLSAGKLRDVARRAHRASGDSAADSTDGSAMARDDADHRVDPSIEGLDDATRAALEELIDDLE